MGEGRRRWVRAVPTLASFLIFLTGFLSENVVTMVLGLAVAFAFTSLFLTNYFESERRVKKASEVVSGFVAMGIIVYGYVLTGSLILGAITLFIVAMFFVAFTLSYLLPKLRGKTKLQLR